MEDEGSLTRLYKSWFGEDELGEDDSISDSDEVYVKRGEDEKEVDKWRVYMRPPLGLETTTNGCLFQMVDITQGICPVTNRPLIRVWGTTKEGNSVMMQIAHFRPYFYASIPHDKMSQMRERIEQFMLSQKRPREKTDKFVISVEPVHKRTIFGWHRNGGLEEMVKITMVHPGHVKKARDALEGKNTSVVLSGKIVKTYEANVPFELRFMVDYGLVGCQWIELPKDAHPVENVKKTSTAQLEYHVESFKCVPVNDMGEIAPIRILSFDIEAKRKAPGFCKASEDPCILICCALHVYGQATQFAHKVVFALAESIGQVEHADEIHTFTHESEMLLAFSNYITECDPDGLTGWNTGGFDWPYLCGRAKELDIFDEFMSFSRMKQGRVFIKSSTFQSKAHGTRESNDLTCEGRFDYDGLTFMLRGQLTKYRNYTLNHISKETLNDQKLDVHHSLIPVLHEGSDADRGRLAEYCLYDSMLPVMILDKLQAIINGVEQARVTGIPIKFLLTRGQGVKTFSNILRYKNADELIPSRSPKQNKMFTPGGYVRKPIAGFYPYPLVTLDFSSLYPSIMIAFNICYSTIESLAWARQNLKPDDYWVPQIENVEFCFVKEHIRKGILPKLVASLLSQRGYVKTLMKKADHKHLYKVYDGRQLSLKTAANSAYGFTKGYVICDQRLMTAVTTWGKSMILKTAAIIEQRYGATIVYGDTDSVVVDFGEKEVSEITRLGHEAAALCSEQMVKPNSLAFESVKLRSLFLKPKMYASLEILAGDIKPGETTAQVVERAKVSLKGLMGKRRDNAPIGAETQKYVLNKILKEMNVQAAVEYTKSVIADVLMDRIDLSKLVITKGLSKTEEQYAKGGTKQQHVELKKRIAKRAKFTGEVIPDTGDRVPYIVKAGSEKACELSEDPLYAQKMGVPINTSYYIRKQIMPAVLRVLTAVWEPKKLDLIESTMSEKNLRQLQAYTTLFAPSLPHMLVHYVRKVRSYGIASFTKAQPSCLQPGCNVRIQSGVSCEYHDRDEVVSYLNQKHDELVAKNEQAWETCRKCVSGIGLDPKNCSNFTCHNYFARYRTIIDIEDLDKDMERMGEKNVELKEKDMKQKVSRGGGDGAVVVVQQQQTKKQKSIQDFF